MCFPKEWEDVGGTSNSKIWHDTLAVKINSIYNSLDYLREAGLLTGDIISRYIQ